MPTRGFNINGNATAQDVIDAGMNGSRLLRYQILPGLSLPVEAWDAHIASAIAHLDQVVVPNLGPQKLILDMHSAPGGLYKRKLRIFSDPVAMHHFTASWQRIVSHFRGYPPILGYGLINEPAGSAEEVQNLHVYMHRIVRDLDPARIICVTCPHSKPSSFSDTIYILGDPNVWYEAHYYEPLKLTHQGLLGYKRGKRYPTRTFGKSQLIKACRPILKFQQRFGVQIFVGEFSISAMADPVSRGNYIRDCLELFDGFGWHHTYHCWREGPGSAWSPEGQPQIMGPLHASLGAQ